MVEVAAQKIDSVFDEDEKPAAKSAAPAKPAAMVDAKKESSSDGDSCDEDDKPIAKKALCDLAYVEPF